MHGWRGCKRLYYEFGEIVFKAGDSITQKYLLQLGSSASDALPDLSQIEVCREIAQRYRD
ncbi:MAG: hypothetical protein ACI8UO_004405 [Verrucomicrobiales bacterium]|jgi:hypothetical protein